MELVFQELICKVKAADFLKEREQCNNEYVKVWVNKYIGLKECPIWRVGFEFKCNVEYTNMHNRYSVQCSSLMLVSHSSVWNAFIDMLTKKWKDVKTEDENENDTIAALILGIMRLEDADCINFRPNYLAIHEALCSPHQYDILTKMSNRALILGMTSALKPRVEYTDISRWTADCTTYSIDYCNDDDNILYENANLLMYK